jgi:hypothetical protein
MDIITLYRSRYEDSVVGQQVRTLLDQTHWFTVNADFDPKTGESLPQALSAFLAKVAHPSTDGKLHDRLCRITDHARPSVEQLFRALNESPRREQALLPVRAVRELDVSSFVKLSNRPGRNIREKIAGKPYLQAVRRFQSINLSENRLLKTFVIRLAELLELRHDCLGEAEDELLSKIQSWLLSDEAQAIDRWDNLPPNNTLLSHRDYRRVWDAWRWLQTLDDDIDDDFSQLEVRAEAMRLWNEYGRMYFDGTNLFAEMPVHFDYGKFEIRPWLSHLAFQKGTRKITRSSDTIEIFEPVCIDLAVLRPHYATTIKASLSLHNSYLWQQWKTEKEFVDIELFNSDAAYLHPDATSISSTDLFFSTDNSLDHLDCAARAFASKLREIFKDDTFIWLVPDFLTDFELEIIRRNLNARFPSAEPLPRSVAAVFEQFDYSKIKNDDFPIVVVDTIGGKTCVTKLIARLDPELKKRLPETNGFFWKRCPPVIISHRDTESAEGKECHNYDIITVDGKGQWRDRIRKEKPQFIDTNLLKRDPRIGQFEFCINLTESPVVGGIRLRALQQRAGDIPLWRYNIPELSIKGMIDGLYQRFFLVGKNTTVRPVRGETVPIVINAHFSLTAGSPFYPFPLYQGENADELGFSARLDSPAFPLKTDAVCKLDLTFEYGADEPYKLIFESLDNSFQPVRATWRPTEEVIITDAPVPGYPIPMTWENLRHFPDIKKGGTINLIQQIGSTAEHLNNWLRRGDDGAWDKLKKNMKGWCRFLFLSVWRDGRSLSDSGCPTECVDAAKDLLATIRGFVTLQVAVEHGIAEFDVMWLFCAVHKDMPDKCVGRVQQWTEEQDDKYARLIGFALGDVSKDWQKTVLSALLKEPHDFTLNALSYAIWREQYFVEKFTAAELRRVLKGVSVRLANIKPLKLEYYTQQRDKRQWIWGRTIAEPLELLLGLLRTRASTNHEIKMLLQPHQKITKELANQVERVTEILAQSKVNLFSRVQLNIQKPADDRTPDLLYALRIYLTGDDGANAIHITSVSDNDND